MPEDARVLQPGDGARGIAKEPDPGRPLEVDVEEPVGRLRQEFDPRSVALAPDVDEQPTADVRDVDIDGTGAHVDPVRPGKGSEAGSIDVRGKAGAALRVDLRQAIGTELREGRLLREERRQFEHASTLCRRLRPVDPHGMVIIEKVVDVHDAARATVTVVDALSIRSTVAYRGHVQRSRGDSDW